MTPDRPAGVAVLALASGQGGGRKATCVVMDERGDLIVFDGLRP